MLESNKIPSKEPFIRVGIILPEDQTEKINIVLPENNEYQISSTDGKSEILHSGNLRISKTNKMINTEQFGLSASWKITPISKSDISPQSGIKVKNVVSGRGFHWHKFIDVYLSGSIEISIINNYLILINELPLEEYLTCVATSEMSAECPDALIEAQTIAARSWMLANVERKHKDWKMDVCNDDCCQRYQGTTYLSQQSIAGAKNTFGQVLLYDNKICDARYSKSCGGIMETYPTIWAGADVPYLINKCDDLETFANHKLPLVTDEQIKHWVETMPKSFCSPEIVPEAKLKKYLGNVDEQGNYFRWQVHYTQHELTELLNNKLNLHAKCISGLKALSRGGSGRIIELEISYLTKDKVIKKYAVKRDVEIRRVLHNHFLYSSCIYFKLENFKKKIPQDITIMGAGWGHGVGLCQIGALGMSLNGYSTDEILCHYFPDSQLKKIY